MGDEQSESTKSELWPYKGKEIDLTYLLALIEERGGTEQLDLRGVVLRFADLRRPALQPYLDRWRGDAHPPWLYGPWGINLQGALLDDANLTASYLDGANLMKASLRRAMLFSTSLREASLIAASLNSAYLHSANLTGAGLQNADLENADLSQADLTGALVDGANFAGTKFFEARLYDTDFYNVTSLHDTYWWRAKLSNTRIRCGQLGRAIGDERAARGQGLEPHATPIELQYYTFKNAMESYELLRINFESIGRYADASLALIKERQMEKAMYFPSDLGQRWLNARRGAGAAPPLRLRTVSRWIRWKIRSAWYNLILFVGFARVGSSRAQ